MGPLKEKWVFNVTKADLNKQLLNINMILKTTRDLELLKLRKEIVQAKRLFTQDEDLNKLLVDKCEKALMKYDKGN